MYDNSCINASELYCIVCNFNTMMRYLTSRVLLQASSIKQVKARQIFDSRGNPTIEADVITDLGVFRAAVPSGASTGKYEALELRDGVKTEYMGKGVSKAVNNVLNVISPALKGWDPVRQVDIDNLMVKELDGTSNEFGYCKNKLGANAILSVSLAVARAGAAAKNVPLYEHVKSLTNLKNKSKYVLPTPSFNVINGGKHGGNGLAMQEFMILPTGASSFTHAMRAGSEVYHHLMKIIKKKYGLNATNVGDEGGFAPTVNDGYEALELLQSAIHSAGHQNIMQIGMDIAASEFYNETTKKYDLHFKDEKLSQSVPHLSSAELYKVYAGYVSKYPIVSIEDPFDQDDWDGYQHMTAQLGEKVQIVGDDLLVTNPKRIATGIQRKSCTALLLKVNQIGTLTESIQAYEQSKDNKWGVMVSHRSGETEDSFIADLVVGLSTGQIKTGAPSRSERLAKYNQLLRIEE
jgi:enolase